MHNIHQHDRQEGLKQAWHGLTVLRPNLTLGDNWLTRWDVVARPIYFEGGEKLPYEQLVCSDDGKILVGAPFNPNSFRPITNAEFLQMIEEALSGTDHKLTSIGSIRNRGRVFASFELVQLEKYTAGGRRFEPFLNFGNGHDKSSVFWASTSNICTVCDNTFTMNLLQVENKEKQGDGLKLQSRHTKNVHLKLPDMAKVIDKAVGVQAEFAAAFESFADTPVTQKRAERIYTGFVVPPDAERVSTRAKNVVDEMLTLFKSGRGNDGKNMADLFSGTTDYYSHSNSGGDNRMKQFVSSEFGSGATRKVDFYQMIQNPERLAKVEKTGADLLAV